MTRVESQPSPARKKLAALPVVDTEWQFGPLRLWEAFRDEQGMLAGYYLPLCADAQGLPLTSPDMLRMPVDVRECVRALLDACERGGCRPARWVVTEPHLVRELVRWLPEDASLRYEPAPPAWRTLASLLAGLGGAAPSGIFESTGVQPPDMFAFCNAAAEFYRHRPWKKIPLGQPIAIDPAQPDELPRVVVVINDKSFGTGLVGFDSFEALWRLFTRGQPPRHGWWLNFLPRNKLPWQDQQDFAQHGWPVAFKKAHPLLVRLYENIPFRHARRDELRFFTFLLLALAHATPKLATGETVDMKVRGGLGEAHFRLRPMND